MFEFTGADPERGAGGGRDAGGGGDRPPILAKIDIFLNEKLVPLDGTPPPPPTHTHTHLKIHVPVASCFFWSSHICNSYNYGLGSAW